jgi:hypothetical protein
LPMQIRLQRFQPPQTTQTSFAGIDEVGCAVLLRPCLNRRSKTQKPGREAGASNLLSAGAIWKLREKSRASLRVTGEPVPGPGQASLDESWKDAWGRTGSSPAHPFGNLATIGGKAEGPWLCAPVSRRVCPFEDERRWDPGATPRLAPGDRHQDWQPPFAMEL